MKTDEIVQQILSKHSGISKEEVMDRLEKEKHRTNGLISDVTLLRMIAAELGVETQNNDGGMAHELSIANLVPSLNNVTVIGRVVAVFAPKSFNGKRSGKLASFLVADTSGLLRVVLWNDKTSLIESGEIEVGQVTRISHGYTKEGQAGVELHVGEKCQVEINPQEVKAEDFPTIRKFTARINEIACVQGNRKVNVIGTIRKLLSTSTFERHDSSIGRVMRFILTDETGEIAVVAWNEKVAELDRIVGKDVELQIVNAKVKKAIGEGVEIHVDTGTYVGILPLVDKFLKIADLKEGLTKVNVQGEIATKAASRDVKTSKDELVKLAGFELKDETGRIWVSAWRRHVDIISSLEKGERISIKNAYVKKGFGDQLEISTRDATSITVIQ
jgi:replication factor A1